MAFHIFVLVAVTAWLCLWRWRNWKLMHLSKVFKTDIPSMPIIGHAYKFLGSDEVQMKVFQEFGLESIEKGGVGSMWLGNILFLMITDPEVSDFILKNYLEKTNVLKFARDVIGNGSIFAPVPIWRPRRKILVPAFSPKNIQQFCQVFAKQSSILAENLESKVGTGPFSIWNYFTNYTMDAICETTMGIRIDAQTNEEHEFIRKFDIGSNLIATRMVSPWFYSDFIYRLTPSYRTLLQCKQFLSDFMGEIIRTKRKEMEIRSQIIDNTDKDDFKKYSQKSFLELLIESSGGLKGYSDEELQEEIQVMVMAGNDTSAVASSFITLMLARYPEVQERAYQEIKDVFGNSSRAITPEDLTRVRYVDAVIKETMRLYPPVPLIARECDRDLTLPSGITIVKGTNAVINIWALHRNPKYWGPDAGEFRPERWLEMEAFQHPAQYIAFSYGPRNCIGYKFAILSIKTVICSLLRRYCVLPDSEPTTVNGHVKHKPIRVKYDIMMKDVENYIVRLESRA